MSTTKTRPAVPDHNPTDYLPKKLNDEQRLAVYNGLAAMWASYQDGVEDGDFSGVCGHYASGIRMAILAHADIYDLTEDDLDALADRQREADGYAAPRRKHAKTAIDAMRRFYTRRAK